MAQGFSPAISVRLVEDPGIELFARTSAAGWSHAGIDEFILQMARAHAASEGVALLTTHG